MNICFRMTTLLNSASVQVMLINKPLYYSVYFFKIPTDKTPLTLLINICLKESNPSAWSSSLLVCFNNQLNIKKWYESGRLVTRQDHKQLTWLMVRPKIYIVYYNGTQIVNIILIKKTKRQQKTAKKIYIILFIFY